MNAACALLGLILFYAAIMSMCVSMRLINLAYHREYFIEVDPNTGGNSTYSVRNFYASSESPVYQNLSLVELEQIVRLKMDFGAVFFFNCSSPGFFSQFDALLPIKAHDVCHFVPDLVTNKKTEKEVYNAALSIFDIDLSVLYPNRTQVYSTLEVREYSIKKYYLHKRQIFLENNEVIEGITEISFPSLRHLISYVGNYDFTYQRECFGILNLLDLQSYINPSNPFYDKIWQDINHLFTVRNLFKSTKNCPQ